MNFNANNSPYLGVILAVISLIPVVLTLTVFRPKFKKVDFKNFPIRLNIGSDEVRKVDTRESIGNAVYHNAAGVRGLDLAMKIYKSEGVIELDDGEWSLLMQIANQTLVAPVVETLINIGKEE